MLRAIIFIFIGYIMAAPLTSHISMDVSLTHWSNIWTYVFWLFSFLIWRFIIFATLMVTAYITATLLDR